MKVLFIHGLYHPYIGGGAEITLKNLVEALPAENHEPVVMSIGPQPGMVREVIEGVPVWRVGIRNFYFPDGRKDQPGWKRALWHVIDRYNPWMKACAERIIRIEKPDVVCCHNLAGWSVSVWDALANSGVPFMQVLHDQYLLCPRSTMFNEDKPCARQCAPCRMLRRSHALRSNDVPAVVGVSDFVLDRLVSRGYFRDTPIKAVIKNRCSLGDGSINNERPADGIRFGFIGTLAPNKGIELLLDIFARVAAPDWQLLVAGAGRESYEAGLRQRHADARIKFVGHVRPEAFYPKVDATVVPSLWEDTFPGVVLESMNFGIPVIGSNRGGIPEMVLEGETGMIVDVENPDNLAAALHTFADNVAAWREREVIIRQVARQHGDRQHWVRQWADLFRRLSHQKRSQESPSVTADSAGILEKR